MSKTIKVGTTDKVKRGRPGLTPEAREGQLVSLAINLAEEQLRNGTASSQVITHYLKIGSTREKLERERLERENELLRAKAKALESQEKTEQLYRDAIEAMKRYSGYGGDEYDDE